MSEGSDSNGNEVGSYNKHPDGIEDVENSFSGKKNSAQDSDDSNHTSGERCKARILVSVFMSTPGGENLSDSWE